MSKLIVANWKMNPNTPREAIKLARVSDARHVVVAAPFVYLPLVRKAIKRAALGAQDVFFEPRGAYTGEVSPLMLKTLGVRYVIVGHSERRALGETDVMIGKKVKAARAAGLKVVLCVGEPWSVRRRGIAAAKRFVAGQLRADVGITRSSVVSRQSLVIAYEPIWAISTSRGRRDETPADAAAMARYIKEFSIFNFQFSIKVLYGGSVDARNVGPFLAQSEIDGVLVGGASIRPREFAKMIRIAARASA